MFCWPFNPYYQGGSGSRVVVVFRSRGEERGSRYPYHVQSVLLSFPGRDVWRSFHPRVGEWATPQSSLIAEKFHQGLFCFLFRKSAKILSINKASRMQTLPSNRSPQRAGYVHVLKRIISCLHFFFFFCRMLATCWGNDGLLEIFSHFVLRGYRNRTWLSWRNILGRLLPLQM